MTLFQDKLQQPASDSVLFSMWHKSESLVSVWLAQIHNCNFNFVFCLKMNQPRCGPAIVDFNSKSLQVGGVKNTLVHICREVVMAALFRDIILWLYCCTWWIRSWSTWKTVEKASSKYQNQKKKKKKWNCWASHHSESFAVSDSSSLRRRLRCAFSPYSVSWAAALSHWQTDRQPRHCDVFTICSGRTDIGTLGEDETSSWHTRGERRGRGRDLLPDISRYSAESSGSNPSLSLEDRLRTVTADFVFILENREGNLRGERGSWAETELSGNVFWSWMLLILPVTPLTCYQFDLLFVFSFLGHFYFPQNKNNVSIKK